MFDCGFGTTLADLWPRRRQQADHKVRFWSADIAKDVAEFVGRGVEFEEYATETFKTVDHVVTTAGIGRSAWFKDPDGNTIALFQPE